MNLEKNKAASAIQGLLRGKLGRSAAKKREEMIEEERRADVAALGLVRAASTVGEGDKNETIDKALAAADYAQEMAKAAAEQRKQAREEAKRKEEEEERFVFATECR